MKTFFAVSFPYFIVKFVLQHPWPFIMVAGICLVVALAR
jgi:hypothetical protein